MQTVGRESIANLARMARFSDPVIDDLTNSPAHSRSSKERMKERDRRRKQPTDPTPTTPASNLDDPDITSTPTAQDPTIDM